MQGMTHIELHDPTAQLTGQLAGQLGGQITGQQMVEEMNQHMAVAAASQALEQEKAMRNQDFVDSLQAEINRNNSAVFTPNVTQ